MVYSLYGTQASLYTGKARSYLIKQRIDFVNRAAGEAHFREDIVPKIGRLIIPVLETPDGEIIQDSADIIAYVEAKSMARLSAYPTTPLHKLIGQIFELFGGEGLLRPAMHYRWNFDATNRAFLAKDFGSALAPTGAPAEMQEGIFTMVSGRMRQAMANFGVTPECAPAVEASYAEFLKRFDAHLAGSPYLLGGAPTLGDYGLIAPLYAHLARDPYPAQLMKDTAFRVWRWTERMNCADQNAGEYGSPPAVLFADDTVPDSLKRLLAFVAEDYLPEVEAYVRFANDWLAARPELKAGTNGLAQPGDRAIGHVEFDWRGHRLRVAVLPYRLYLLQKIQDVADTAAPEARKAMDALLAETGLSRLLTLRTARRVQRHNNLEVWSAAL